MTGTQALIRAGAESLPTSIYSLADCFGIKIVTYDEFTRVYDISRQELYTYASRGGFSLLTDGRFLCVLNTCLCHQPRRKWTAAHELGHILSGHIVSESSAPTPAPREGSRPLRRRGTCAAACPAFLRSFLRCRDRAPVWNLKAGGGNTVYGTYPTSP